VGWCALRLIRGGPGTGNKITVIENLGATEVIPFSENAGQSVVKDFDWGSSALHSLSGWVH
jgi:hypothetical protein